LMLEAEAYESPLFREQFARRPYAGELYGLFITPDNARMYDYRRDVLAGVAAADFDVPGGPPYYDERAGRICFRLRRDRLAKPLTEYTAMTLIYTGE